MDKAREQAITNGVRRGLRSAMAALGYDSAGSQVFTRIVQGHVCKLWLQKFSRQPAFRVAMTFQPGGDIDRPLTEFADRYTFKDSPSGRQYFFHFLRSEDAAEVCVREIELFAAEVAQPWFEVRLAEAKRLA